MLAFRNSSVTHQNTEGLLIVFRPNHLPVLGGCTVPVNAPIFASKKYFFSLSTSRIYREYTPYENVDLYLKNKTEKTRKKSK